MTTEQYKKLRKYAGKFEETRHGFVRVTRTEMDEFSSIYWEIYGKEVTRNQRTCPHCVLKLFKQVAGDFWNFEKSPAYKKLVKAESDGADS